MDPRFTDANGDPVACRCIVVYLDLLGFTNAIIASRDPSRAPTILRELRQALDDAHRYLKKSIEERAPESRWLIRAHTDNVVIVFPVNDDDLIDAERLFASVARFQLALACRGYFTRGAMAFGDAYLDEYMVFGSALEEVVKAEKEIAREARVIFTSSGGILFEKFGAQLAGVPSVPWKMREDVDGQQFLDYLAYASSMASGNRAEWLAKHRDFVARGLEEFRAKPTIQQKYFWLAKYHNRYCEREIPDPTLLVDLAPALEGPK